MPTEKHFQTETCELLDDINYVNQANRDEIERIKDRINLRIVEAGLQGNIADSLVEEVSSLLGQLLVKVNLVEKAVHSIQPKKKHKSPKTPTKNAVNIGETSQQYSIDQLAGNRNLLPIENSDSGTSYAWSGSDPETQFTFFLDRSKAFGMQIRLFALIKPEYSKQLKIFIDGMYIKHRFGLNEGLYVLSCNLPPASKTSPTEIKIVLPATHSPMDLGTSKDDRKLGLAITEVRFGKPVSGFAYLLKRLKLKT